MRFHRLLMAGLLVSLTIAVQAQTYLGVHVSNYDPLKNQLFNPGLSATSLMKWEVNLMGFDMHAAQDYLKITGSFSDWKDFDRDVNVQENLNGKDKSGNILFDAQWPSFMVNTKKAGAFTFYTRSRAIIEARDVDEGFLSSMYNDPNNIYNWAANINDSGLAFNIHAFTELAVGYSRYIFNNDRHAVSVGANLKLLVPHFAGKAEGNVDITIDTDAGTANFGNTAFSAISSDLLNVIDDEDYNYKFKIGGFGADIGAVYELKTGQGQTKIVGKNKDRVKIQPDYFLKAGFSINDIGNVKYMHSMYSRNFTADGNTVSLESITQDDSTFIDFDEVLNALGSYEEFTGSYKAKLPLHLTMFADVKVTRGIYINAAALINLGSFSADRPKAREQNIYSLTPRFELPAIGIQMPMAYNSFNGFEMGASFRVGGFVVGSSNIFSYLWSREATAFDLQFAVAFGAVDKSKKRAAQDLINERDVQDQELINDEPGKIKKEKKKG